jgi:hypothetical protein
VAAGLLPAVEPGVPSGGEGAVDPESEKMSSDRPGGKMPPSVTSSFVFKTRADSVGLLQITGFPNEPRGVKLRYKLVQLGLLNHRAGTATD